MVKAGEQADWGLTYGFLYLRKLVVFLLPVLPVQIFSTYAANNRLLEDKNLFLVEVVSYLLNAWLLMGITIFTVCKLRGEVVGYRHIFVQALKTMPKVGLSYVVLMSFVVLSIQIPPGLLLLVYLVWAPIFCALEQCAIEDEIDQDSRRDDFESRPRSQLLDDELDIRPTHFQRKSMLDLGLVRSARFTGLNIRESIFFIIIVWAINVIPMGGLSLFSPVGVGSTLELVLLSVVSVFELGVIAGAVLCLLLLLPKDAQAELGFEEAPNLKRLFPGREKALFKFSKSRLRLAALSLVALFATVLILDSLAEERQFPQTATSELKYAQVDQGDFKIGIVVEDLDKEFRWFEKNNFLITLSEENIDTLGSGEAEEQMQPLAPYRVTLHDDEGKRVFDENGLFPYERLTLRLTYSLGGARVLDEEPSDIRAPKKKAKKFNVPEKGRFELSYHAIKGGVRLVAEGRYPRGFMAEERK